MTIPSFDNSSVSLQSEPSYAEYFRLVYADIDGDDGDESQSIGTDNEKEYLSNVKFEGTYQSDNNLLTDLKSTLKQYADAGIDYEVTASDSKGKTAQEMLNYEKDVFAKFSQLADVFGNGDGKTTHDEMKNIVSLVDAGEKDGKVTSVEINNVFNEINSHGSDGNKELSSEEVFAYKFSKMSPQDKLDYQNDLIKIDEESVRGKYDKVGSILDVTEDDIDASDTIDAGFKKSTKEMLRLLQEEARDKNGTATLYDDMKTNYDDNKGKIIIDGKISGKEQTIINDIKSLSNITGGPFGISDEEIAKYAQFIGIDNEADIKALQDLVKEKKQDIFINRKSIDGDDDETSALEKKVVESMLSHFGKKSINDLDLGDDSVLQEIVDYGRNYLGLVDENDTYELLRIVHNY